MDQAYIQASGSRVSKYLEGGGEGGGEERNESHTCISMQYHTAHTSHTAHKHVVPLFSSTYSVRDSIPPESPNVPAREPA